MKLTNTSKDILRGNLKEGEFCVVPGGSIDLDQPKDHPQIVDLMNNKILVAEVKDDKKAK